MKSADQSANQARPKGDDRRRKAQTKAQNEHSRRGDTNPKAEDGKRTKAQNEDGRRGNTNPKGEDEKRRPKRKPSKAEGKAEDERRRLKRKPSKAKGG